MPDRIRSQFRLLACANSEVVVLVVVVVQLVSEFLEVSECLNV